MNNYWKDRVTQLENSNFISNEKFIDFLYEQYDKVLHDIDQEIYNFLVKIADDNQTTLHEASKLLDKRELKGFKMNLRDFVNNSKNAEYISDEVMVELNNASHAYRISKLQAMEVQLKAQVERLLNLEQQEVFDHLKEQYKDNYYRSVYDMQNVTGYKHIQKIPESRLDLLLNKPWADDGRNFSERIWNRRDKLINELHRELTQGLIRGDSADKITNILSKRLGVSKTNAKALVITESSFIFSQSRHDTFTDMGVEQFQNVATLDYKTSDICRHMDGTVFNESDRKIGINCAPFHTRCRTVDVPHFNDDIQRELETTRMARDPITGKSKLVNSMEYDEWYAKYVESNPEAVAKEKGWKNRHNDRKQYANYKEVLGKEIPSKFDEFQYLKYNKSKEWEVKKREFDTIRNIKSKSQHPIEYINKKINLYYEFRGKGYEFTSHSLDRVISPKEGKGKENFTIDDVLKLLAKEPNYYESKTNRTVKYYNNLVIIQNEETKEVVSVVYRKTLKESWGEYNEN